MKPKWIDKHSVNCVLCKGLHDERECNRYINDEGSICTECTRLVESSTDLLDACKYAISVIEGEGILWNVQKSLQEAIEKAEK